MELANPTVLKRNVTEDTHGRAGSAGNGTVHSLDKRFLSTCYEGTGKSKGVKIQCFPPQFNMKLSVSPPMEKATQTDGDEKDNWQLADQPGTSSAYWARQVSNAAKWQV